MKKLFVLFVFFCSCRTSRIDHHTGDLNPTANTVHMNKVHKIAWHAGKNLIVPAGFTPIKATVKK